MCLTLLITLVNVANLFSYQVAVGTDRIIGKRAYLNKDLHAQIQIQWKFYFPMIY